MDGVGGGVEKKWRRLKYLMARVRLPKISSNRRIYFVHISLVFFFYFFASGPSCVCVYVRATLNLALAVFLRRL